MAKRPTPKYNCSECEHIHTYKYYSGNRWNYEGWTCDLNEVILSDTKNSVCPKFLEKSNTFEAWDKLTQGKTVGEWPPIPDNIEFIKYENGIILTTEETIEKWLKEAKNQCLTK